MPRYMLLIKASPDAENPEATTPEIFEEMTTFNENLNAAGVLVSGEGLRPTNVDSYRLSYSSDGPPQVTEGPFDVKKEAHVCGWWILKTKDADEALSWAKKVPFKEGELVMRRIAEMDDFGDQVSESVRDREEKLREELEKQNQK
ncbi:dgpfaetke family [Fusarium albosuccineum]|uniref:Dgpfaetke family n=1 Tax=Fusarium albosuccineum TaxID=1237068 RepID=A0A8H4LPM8_9HYPO|nr:dgpfaetke family [Fusarium albosuccineum]